MTKPTLKTRKPIDKLRPLDIKTFPIWEFATDEEDVPERDETWVRPVQAKIIPPDSYSLAVAAEFTLANGTRMLGIIEVTSQGALKIGYASLITDQDYLVVPSGVGPLIGYDRSTLVKRLELHEKSTFPIRYRLLVLAESESKLRTGIFE